MSRKIAVLGAGMVGVSVALELQRRGQQVTLIDRRDPGQETSFGNAGVLSRGSLLPLNNPGLWRTLPGLIGNRQAGLRYDPAYLWRNRGWVLRFLAQAREGPTQTTAAALDALYQLSRPQHERYLREGGRLELLRRDGWMYLYRSEAAFARSAVLRRYLALHDVGFDCLDGAAVREALPMLRPVFARALWIRDAASVVDPGQVVANAARLLVAAGGQVVRAEITQPQRDGAGWQLGSNLDPNLDPNWGPFDQIALCAGPWSRAILERMGYRVPLVTERGYHMHFSGSGEGAGDDGVRDVGRNARLPRPIYDTGGGYVLSPMPRGLRLLSGVELCDVEAPPNPAQLQLAEANARKVIDLGTRIDAEPWMGARPTLPDSRPAIGALQAAPGLFVGFGHQHVGFSTGPGTGVLLADLMTGAAPSIDPTPFDPARFIRKSRQARG